MLPLGRVLALAAALLVLTAMPPFVRPATAGCGCDHPPPAFALVMPPFGSPGRTIRLYADGGFFVPGARYSIAFQPTASGLASAATVVAFRPDRLEVAVPSNLTPGPMKLVVKGPGYSKTYGADLFTALPLPRRLPTGDASISVKGLQGAVTTDGTLLVPVDLTDISDATQFAFLLTNVPLGFQAGDVVFYNKDGVELTLFTLQVDDPTSRQWGSYHGWEVEDDASFHNVVYENKVLLSSKLDRQSDLLTYWRHEFYTYKRAHAPGGSHVVNADGFHPDGTLHIDHDQLVLAIHGKVRDQTAPTDASRQKPLDPGPRSIDLLATAAVARDPIEPEEMARRAMASREYSELTGGLNDTLAGLTGQTDSVAVSQGPLGLGTTTNVLLKPLTK
jgi:hypothetical protein